MTGLGVRFMAEREVGFEAILHMHSHIENGEVSVDCGCRVDGHIAKAGRVKSNQPIVKTPVATNLLDACGLWHDDDSGIGQIAFRCAAR